MKIQMRGVGLWLLALGLVLCATPVLAQTTASDGQLGVELTRSMYCGFKDLIGGTLGLMLGFLMVVSGIWRLIRGAGFVEAGILILFGSMITSLPGLVESSFSGFNQLLREAQLVTTEYNPPCSSMVTPPPRPNSLDDENNYWIENILMD
jgi:hypothetical protein